MQRTRRLPCPTGHSTPSALASVCAKPASIATRAACDALAISTTSHPCATFFTVTATALATLAESSTSAATPVSPGCTLSAATPV